MFNIPSNVCFQFIMLQGNRLMQVPELLGEVTSCVLGKSDSYASKKLNCNCKQDALETDWNSKGLFDHRHFDYIHVVGPYHVVGKTQYKCIYLIIYTCAFPAVRCQNIFCGKKGLLLK